MGNRSGCGRGAGPEGEGLRDGGGDGGNGQAKRKGPAGRIARASGKDGPQIVQSGGKRWTAEAEEIFLDYLAITANYTLAAKKTGFSREAIYKRRRRDPAFAERCRAAIAQAVDNIDALLVEGAERALAGRAPARDSPIPPMTVEQAIAVVKLHRPAVTGQGRLAGWRGPARPLAAVKASILTKLSAIERHRLSGGMSRPPSPPETAEDCRGQSSPAHPSTEIRKVERHRGKT